MAIPAIHCLGRGHREGGARHLLRAQHRQTVWCRERSLSTLEITSAHDANFSLCADADPGCRSEKTDKDGHSVSSGRLY